MQLSSCAKHWDGEIQNLTPWHPVSWRKCVTAKQFSFCCGKFTGSVTPDDSCSNESLVMLRINRHMTLCVMHKDVMVCSDFSFKTRSHNHSYLRIMKRQSNEMRVVINACSKLQFHSLHTAHQCTVERATYTLTDLNSVLHCWSKSKHKITKNKTKHGRLSVIP